MERLKRSINDEADSKILEPVLIRVNNEKDRIHIDKDEFKIGRAKDNDEIIIDVAVSRRHCILRCEGQDEWTIKDLSSSATFVNNVAILHGATQKVKCGDIIQFSYNNAFKYVFTLAEQEYCIKKPRIDENILDNVLTQQKTFAESQECQRKELKDKLEIKQKEQVELKQQLEDLLSQQVATKEHVNKEDLIKQIASLECKIESTKTQEQHLHHMYSQLLEKLENERLQFETRLNKEKQKWQEALNMSKQEKEMVEVKMREQMEKWREEQQAEWKSMMESKVKEEKNIQAQLLNEKNMLEEKLKETEKALKEQEAKAETSQAILNANVIVDSTLNTADNCIFLGILNEKNEEEMHVIDTIDLTEFTENMEINTNNGVLKKVSGIMDDQLTCSICSELFVNATTLNCTHTFCSYCINAWNKKRKQCPVCRKAVISMNRSLVLDNFIESMIENLPKDLQDKRKEVLQERRDQEKKKCCSKTKRKETNYIVL